METSIAIKLPKGIALEGAKVTKYRDGRTFIKIGETTYKVLDISLEIPKYVITEGRKIFSKVTSRGVLKKQQ